MAKPFIYWSSIPKDLACPRCGSNVFEIFGDYIVEFAAKAHSSKDKLMIDRIIRRDFGDVWKRVEQVKCAKCGEDLSSILGLKVEL